MRNYIQKNSSSNSILQCQKLVLKMESIDGVIKRFLYTILINWCYNWVTSNEMRIRIRKTLASLYRDFRLNKIFI